MRASFEKVEPVTDTDEDITDNEDINSEEDKITTFLHRSPSLSEMTEACFTDDLSDSDEKKTLIRELQTASNLQNMIELIDTYCGFNKSWQVKSLFTQACAFFGRHISCDYSFLHLLLTLKQEISDYLNENPELGETVSNEETSKNSNKETKESRATPNL